MPTQVQPRLSIFANEPFTDFAQPREEQAIRAAIGGARAALGRSYESFFTAGKAALERVVSVNPANPGEVIGVHYGSPAEVDEAVRRAERAFSEWSRSELATRTGLLRRTAAKLRESKHTFSAWLVLEAGKNWAEADADTAEAIDFLEFYAMQAERLAETSPAIQYPGEDDKLRYLPLGPGVVLPPWNFPLAILAGMTCAAIVAGNTVVLKPSPLAPTVGRLFVDLLTECGMPEGVVNLVQGGTAVGAAMVAHPRVRFVAFTGSKRAGLEIHARAAQTPPEQHWIKRTILELGGKDAIIVHRDADLEMAAEGVVASAFGFSGQKCSACSRLIVHEDVYEDMLGAVMEKTAKLAWGDPAENRAVTPVIDEVAYRRVLQYVADAPRQGRVIVGGKALTAPERGYYVAPTIVADVDAGSPLAQEEIFGPVLAAIKARSFDEALRIANGTPYGLTGAVYSNSEEYLDRAAEEFHVGNLYLNRKCTGAMVGAHPFGGFNLSGTDSKAGGEDYLLHFTQAKSIARRVG